MRVIIAGSRGIKDYDALVETIENAGILDDIEEIVTGGALGVDALAEEFAEREGIPLRVFYPDWKRFGRAAGPIRNEQMAEYADCLIALWDGESKGTRNMIAEARKRSLKHYVHVPDGVPVRGIL